MRDFSHRVWNKLSPGRDYIAESEIPPNEARPLSKSGLGKLFFGHKGRTIWKWVHYLDIYDKHFSAYRKRPINFLEIGVFEGGSLEMWRKYFHIDATIYGIDIDPRCAHFVDEPNQVRIGSQDNASFLLSVAKEMGGLDIVLDDGSHVGKHQRTSFETLFPLLNEGGIYAIEDLHTSYWPGFFKGGYKRQGTGIDLVKGLIDDLHGWWHNRRGIADIGAIHVYDSIVFIEKRKNTQPHTVKIG